jgi:hypothetical protein
MRENSIEQNIEMLIYYLRMKNLKHPDQISGRDVDEGIRTYMEKLSLNIYNELKIYGAAFKN